MRLLCGTQCSSPTLAQHETCGFILDADPISCCATPSLSIQDWVRLLKWLDMFDERDEQGNLPSFPQGHLRVRIIRSSFRLSHGDQIHCKTLLPTLLLGGAPRRCLRATSIVGRLTTSHPISKQAPNRFRSSMALAYWCSSIAYEVKNDRHQSCST